jgi:hypothetical protein
VNGIVFVISFSAYSLLLYRKVTDFCMLVLYPENIYQSKRFFWWSLGFLKYRIILSANGDNLTSFFPICIPFISLLPYCSG